VLIAHLKLEDDRLYPALEMSAERSVRETAIRYRMEMGGLKAQFVQMLETFGTEDKIALDQTAFLETWSVFRKALETRMAKEDHGLYEIADEYLTHNEAG